MTCPKFSHANRLMKTSNSKESRILLITALPCMQGWSFIPGIQIPTPSSLFRGRFLGENEEIGEEIGGMIFFFFPQIEMGIGMRGPLLIGPFPHFPQKFMGMGMGVGSPIPISPFPPNLKYNIYIYIYIFVYRFFIISSS